MNTSRSAAYPRQIRPAGAQAGFRGGLGRLHQLSGHLNDCLPIDSASCCAPYGQGLKRSIRAIWEQASADVLPRISFRTRLKVPGAPREVFAHSKAKN